ncbi:MAG: hypothetical protein JWN17_1023 [Frankiales bacterium]|nr:hypothetical protein [Frankiales bacterium]
MPDRAEYKGLWLYLGRRLLTSYGGRGNAAQGLRNVRRDQADRAEADRAVADAQRGLPRPGDRDGPAAT